MAPPIPGLRKPVQVPTRTAGDALIGILAIMALAVLTIGVPVALITIIGLPVPHGTASLSVLTHQLGIPSILRVLSVVIWLAWLQLVWCVIVEIKAAVRNVGLPAQVPLAGATQSAAHRLVTAALLLFTAGAALSPAFARSGPPRPSHTVSSVMPGTRGMQGPQSTAPQPAAPPTVAQLPGAAKVYVVKPPDGRYHESLWEIAENHLGDGRRYPEIYAMNKDRIQPDGSQLTIASLIRRVQAWLGPDDVGRPNLTADAGGRLRLGSQVRVDWLVFRALLVQAGHAAENGRTDEEAAALDRALGLVRGQLLDGRDPSRYAWLGTDSFTYEATAQIADAAHRLSALRLMAGDAEGAMAVARAGLRLAFNDEMLWRGLLLGASATGQEHVLRAVVGEVSARAELDEVMPRMAPETEALIDELLPSWRTSAA